MALKGIKVIELAGLAPVPYCGMVLADFGANVLRVDRVGNSVDVDISSNGKQSIAIDLKTKEGVNVLRRLCKTSDVLVEPYRKGVMEKLGLGPEVLLKDNPRLIYARLTGYGQNGPYCRSAGHDINYISLSGMLSLIGRFGEKPVPPVNLLGDFAAGGLMCAFGILLALFERTKSNRGQVIDSNMVEGAAYIGSWLFRAKHLPIWGNERGKNIIDTGAHFYEVYETKDKKYVAVGAIEPQFYENLLKGLGLNSNDVPQYSEFENGKKIFENKFKEKTRDEWCRIFDKIDGCVTPVLSLDEVAEHPHNKERKTFEKINGDVIPRPAPILSETPGELVAKKPAPRRGEHTKSILYSLGYTDEEIANLISNGAVECFTPGKL